jgi:hypothetical protein
MLKKIGTVKSPRYENKFYEVSWDANNGTVWVDKKKNRLTYQRQVGENAKSEEDAKKVVLAYLEKNEELVF